MKVENFETTIKELMKFEHKRVDKFYADFSEFTIFEPLAGLYTFGMSFKTTDDLIQREYVQDLCNDGRLRDVAILFYKEKPFVIFQYRGKGNYENEAIFDKETYKSFINDYITEYLNQQEIKVVEPDSKYTVQNYNMAYFEIENNKIVAKTDYR